MCGVHCVQLWMRLSGVLYLQFVQTAYHAQELEMKQAYYKDRIEDEERVRSIYHDLKNHLLVLQAQAGNGQAVQNSIQGLQNQLQEYETYYQTGNEYLDILIRDKARAAQERQIDFAAAVAFADGAFIDPLDLARSLEMPSTMQSRRVRSCLSRSGSSQ